jgi:hypothetical protein
MHRNKPDIETGSLSFNLQENLPLAGFAQQGERTRLF